MNAAELKTASGSRAGFRVALLYDLSGNPSERNRVLKGMLQPKLVRDFSANEELWAATLRDSGMLQASSLSYPFSKDLKTKIANELELAGEGNAKTRELLLSAESYPGGAWSNLVLGELSALAREQAKITLSGRQSRKHFTRRAALLKELSAVAKKYLNVADSPTRVEIASVLLGAYDGFARDILNSPIPEGIQPSDVAQVKEALAKMAAPFLEQSKDALELAKRELDQVKDENVRARLEPLLSGERLRIGQAAPRPRTGPTAAEISALQRSAEYRQWLERLHRNPVDQDAIASLGAMYRRIGAVRMAAYFEGRARTAGGKEGKS
jgi:hypothetical protein